MRLCKFVGFRFLTRTNTQHQRLRNETILTFHVKSRILNNSGSSTCVTGAGPSRSTLLCDKLSPIPRYSAPHRCVFSLSTHHATSTSSIAPHQKDRQMGPCMCLPTTMVTQFSKRRSFTCARSPHFPAIPYAPPFHPLAAWSPNTVRCGGAWM